MALRFILQHFLQLVVFLLLRLGRLFTIPFSAFCFGEFCFAGRRRIVGPGHRLIRIITAASSLVGRLSGHCMNLKLVLTHKSHLGLGPIFRRLLEGLDFLAVRCLLGPVPRRVVSSVSDWRRRYSSRLVIYSSIRVIGSSISGFRTASTVCASVVGANIGNYISVVAIVAYISFVAVVYTRVSGSVIDVVSTSRAGSVSAVCFVGATWASSS